MAAIFIPVSASTIFDLERDNTYINTLKAHANVVFNQASLNSVIVSSTFTHTTSIDSLSTVKLSISTFLNTLNGADHNLNSVALSVSGLDQAHGSTCP